MAVIVTSIGVIVSVTFAVALAFPTTKLSKFPPVADVIVAVNSLASKYTSSVWLLVIVKVPVVCPSKISIVPLSVTIVVLPWLGFSNVAVNT